MAVKTGLAKAEDSSVWIEFSRNDKLEKNCLRDIYRRYVLFGISISALLGMFCISAVYTYFPEPWMVAFAKAQTIIWLLAMAFGIVSVLNLPIPNCSKCHAKMRRVYILLPTGSKQYWFICSRCRVRVEAGYSISSDSGD